MSDTSMARGPIGGGSGRDGENREEAAGTRKKASSKRAGFISSASKNRFIHPPLWLSPLSIASDRELTHSIARLLALGILTFLALREVGPQRLASTGDPTATLARGSLEALRSELVSVDAWEGGIE